MDSFTFVIFLIGAIVILNILIGRSNKTRAKLRERQKEIRDRRKNEET